MFSKFLVLTLALLPICGLRAQFVTTSSQVTYNGSVNPVNFEFRQDGVWLAEGTAGVGTLTTGDQGAGVRFLWSPGKVAFRAGVALGSEWDDSASTGSYSVAFGYGPKASGTYASALNNTTSATGIGSSAFNYLTVASGDYSLAFGVGSNIAAGDYATVFGRLTTANGDQATALSVSTSATAFNSVVLGRYNKGGGNTTTWVSTDPLFEVGNGATSTTKADAFVVYKNGNAAFQKTLKIPAGGDIPMFSGY